MLLLCLALDLVGGASLFVGEASDALWAPVSAYAHWALFGSVNLTVLDFFQELVPFADLLPLATAAWFLATAYPDSAAARLLGLDLQPPPDD